MNQVLCSMLASDICLFANLILLQKLFGPAISPLDKMKSKQCRISAHTATEDKNEKMHRHI